MIEVWLAITAVAGVVVLLLVVQLPLRRLRRFGNAVSSLRTGVAERATAVRAVMNARRRSHDQPGTGR